MAEPPRLEASVRTSRSEGRAATKTATSDQLTELERLLSLCEVQTVRSGVPLPLGAHRRGHGVNFAIFSRHATGVRLDLFERPRTRSRHAA